MFIEFGTFNIKLLFLLILYPSGGLLENSVLDGCSQLFRYFTAYLSFLIAGPIYLIISRSIKKKTNNIKTTVIANKGSAINQIERQDEKEEKNKKSKKELYLYLLIFLYFLPIFCSEVFSEKVEENETNELRPQLVVFILPTYFYIIFSNFLLKEKIYRHRIFSIIMMTVCFLIFLIYSGKLIFELDNILISLLLQCCIKGINALFSVLLKMYFSTFLIDPYLFIFYLGFYSLLFLIPFEIIYYLIYGEGGKLGKGTISQTKLYLEDENIEKKIFDFFLLIFILSFKYGSQILLVYHFTPSHFIISLMIHALATMIKSFIVGEKEQFDPFTEVFFIVLNVVIFIGCFIYNEIIIIKLCKLEKYTAKYISKRQENEYVNMNQIINDEDDEDEEFNNDDYSVSFTAKKKK